MMEYLSDRKKKNLYPFVIAFFLFLVLVFSTNQFISKQRGEWEKDIRNNLLEVLTANKSRLERALYSRIYYTKGVAAYVSLHPEVTNDDFQNLAKLLIKNDSVISTMSLSKDCIISSIFPKEGHEAAIGLNLMAHPERKYIVEETIETHQTFVAGPVELVEGGIAFISYTPIFNKKLIQEPFWGMTDIVIYRDRLFRDAQLLPRMNGFEFALQGNDGSGAEGEIFWGNPKVFQKKPVTTAIDLPTGKWILAAAPASGWNNYINQDKLLYYTLLISAFIISLLIWLFARAMIRIRNNEKELKAIFKSMHNLVIEYDRNGRYVKIAPTRNSILILPEDQLLGKTVHDVFDPQLAKLILNAIRQCIDTDELVVIEYPLQLNGEEFWFMGRVSKRSEKTVIFSAYDITEKKKSEENIRQSENRLSELNAMKDRFFSLIAHDLKTPVGNFMNLSSLLNEEYDKMDDHQRQSILELLQQSSSEAYELLNNLLNWAMSQQGAIRVHKTHQPFNKLCNQSVAPLNPLAESKHIQINVEVGANTLLYCDEQLTKTILRNLISNAIKFSHEGGIVRIFSSEETIQLKKWTLVHVQDQGTGMHPNKQQQLFQSEVNESIPGTLHETGTGLGLILCKEFSEKQGGFIRVASQLGEGTVFTVGLPSRD